MRLERKEKHAIALKEEQRKNLMIAIARSNDRKSRKAREDFRRPAFYGTVLTAGGQQDPKREEQE